MKLLNINTTGNRKLKNNENVRFIIWNLPACKTCPFKTPSCEKLCYARKAERVYPQVLPSRERNFADSLESDFAENMIFTLEKTLNSKAYRGKLAIVRIHESGDFYNLEYTRKWVEIAKHFENYNGVVFTAYTKSLPFFIECGYDYKQFPKNFIVRSSLWNDTAVLMKEMTVNYNFPIYTALTAEDMEKERANGHDFFTCDCVDCGKCLKCYSNETRDIICKIH